MDVRCDIGFDIVLRSICDGGDDEERDEDGGHETVFTLVRLYSSPRSHPAVSFYRYHYIIFYSVIHLVSRSRSWATCFFFVLLVVVPLSIVYTFC